MIKGITKEQHWITDYSYVPLVMAAPKLIGFDDEEKVARLCYAVSSATLMYSLLTDAKWGAIPLIPYKTHAALDLAQGALALTAASTLKIKNKKARNTLIAMGLTGITVGILSLISAKNKW